tara:strand:- start:740 stop:1306 length:567 start_codon:yes stop_codon:yes gene_type:complete
MTPWYATQKAINVYIIAGIVFVLLLVITSTLGGVNNTYVAKTQNVATSKSNISKEEQRRVDLFNNVADAVQSYNKFEASVFEKITQARSQAAKGNVDEAMLNIQAVVEAYPQLKSQSNYDKAITEFSITENRIAGYREQYNNDVRDFNNYVQSFPAFMFLAILGKDTEQKEYLDYKVDNSEARNLFDN